MRSRRAARGRAADHRRTRMLWSGRSAVGRPWTTCFAPGGVESSTSARRGARRFVEEAPVSLIHPTELTVAELLASAGELVTDADEAARIRRAGRAGGASTARIELHQAVECLTGAQMLVGTTDAGHARVLVKLGVRHAHEAMRHVGPADRDHFSRRAATIIRRCARLLSPIRRGRPAATAPRPRASRRATRASRPRARACASAARRGGGDGGGGDGDSGGSGPPPGALAAGAGAVAPRRDPPDQFTVVRGSISGAPITPAEFRRARKLLITVAIAEWKRRRAARRADGGAGRAL